MPVRGCPPACLSVSPPRWCTGSPRLPGAVSPPRSSFQILRAGLTVKVHQRVNVRVLELIDNAAMHVSNWKATGCRQLIPRTSSTYLEVQAQAISQAALADASCRTAQITLICGRQGPYPSAWQSCRSVSYGARG